jgi:apolipoprotein N-acyltransferase
VFALVVATAASGVLYGLAFPVTRLQPLAWVALIPFFVAVRHARNLRTALFLGWLWMTVMGYTVADWLVTGIARYFEQPLLVGVGLFFYVATFMAGIHYMAFAACYRALGRAARTAVPVLAAAAWVATEFARTYLTGNPWALLGYSQIGILPLMQIADLTGVYGMSFVLAVVNAALAEIWLTRRSGGAALREAVRGGVLSAAVVLVVLGYGVVRLHSPALMPDAPPVKVGLVQGNLDLGTQWREEFYGRNLDAYLRLTQGLLADRDPPAVVFWPENALTFFLADEPHYRAAIGRVLAPSGAQLVTGGPRVVRSPPAPAYHSSVFFLSPQGALLATYDKQKLLPFGEYFPYAGIDILRRHFARVREFAPGAPSLPFQTAAGVAGVTICNEAMFPEIAAERVRQGATYLVDPANDTWLTPKFSAQQFDIVTLRSVEQRRYLVRASTAGPSAIVDPLGRVVLRTDFFIQTALTGDVRPSTVVTPYCHMGDLFAWACVLSAVAAWFVCVRVPQARPDVLERDAA